MTGADRVKDRHLRLPDGRRLGFRIYGDPDGTPSVAIRATPARSLQPVTVRECGFIDGAVTEGGGVRMLSYISARPASACGGTSAACAAARTVAGKGVCCPRLAASSTMLSARA